MEDSSMWVTFHKIPQKSVPENSELRFLDYYVDFVTLL